MNVIIIEHARERMAERGVSEQEVQAVLKAGAPRDERHGRYAKERVFEFSGKWQGRRYPEKKVRVIYIEEAEIQVVITVYAFYGTWGEG